MRRLILVALIGLAAACSTTTNPQVQADTQAAKQIVVDCLPKGDLLTHDGRQAILACIAPPGHGPEFQACASGQLAHAKFLTHADRDALYQELAVCLENNR